MDIVKWTRLKIITVAARTLWKWQNIWNPKPIRRSNHDTSARIDPRHRSGSCRVAPGIELRACGGGRKTDGPGSDYARDDVASRNAAHGNDVRGYRLLLEAMGKNLFSKRAGIQANRNPAIRCHRADRRDRRGHHQILSLI